MTGPHQGQPVFSAGTDLEEAQGVLVLIHGRGDNARGIMYLAGELSHEGLAYIAPQAADNSWYPYRFIVPLAQNEPHLSSALAVVDKVMAVVEEAGIPSDKVFLAGFSQGACLVLEYAARHPRRYGGVFGFSGGLIGPLDMVFDYAGRLENTPIFLGCSDVDSHIPRERVETTAEVLANMGGIVDMRLYPNMGHTINEEELNAAKAIIDKALADRPPNNG